MKGVALWLANPFRQGADLRAASLKLGIPKGTIVPRRSATRSALVVMAGHGDALG